MQIHKEKMPGESKLSHDWNTLKASKQKHFMPLRIVSSIRLVSTTGEKIPGKHSFELNVASVFPACSAIIALGRKLP